MIRHLLIATAIISTTFPCAGASAADSSKLIARTTAARHGLARPWFAQVQLDRGRGRLTHVVLYDGTIYAQTNKAIVQAIDAETGETLWTRRVGRPQHPSLAPAVARDMLAVVNGSRLYVVNRYNGDMLYESKVKGAPGAGPAMSDKRVYVPMVQGMIMAYRLESLTDPQKELGFGKKWEEMNDEERAIAEEDRRENLRVGQEYIPPLACQSLGRTSIQPLITEQNEDEEYCIWPTDRGVINIGRVDRRAEKKLELRHQVSIDGGAAARPTYRPADPDVVGDEGIIYVASVDGFVHAIKEKSGESLWRFSTGESILEPALVVADRVYVATRIGGMFCIDAEQGQELWWAPGVCKFVSASKLRVYGADRSGRIIVLDAKTGARLDSLATQSLSIKIVNTQTDRIYVATDTGLIQCLHEVELTEPFSHLQWVKKQKEIEEKKGNVIQQEGIDQAAGKPKKPVADPKDDPNNPFGDGGDKGDGGDGGGDGGDDPFGDDGGGDGGAVDDDPFGSIHWPSNPADRFVSNCIPA